MTTALVKYESRKCWWHFLPQNTYEEWVRKTILVACAIPKELLGETNSGTSRMMALLNLAVYEDILRRAQVELAKRHCGKDP
jgi:hypothetical protein